MADQRTMAQLLQAPTKGYEDAIVVLVITVDNLNLKHGLLTLVQNKLFFGHDKEDSHAHVRYFNKITTTLKFPNISNTEALDRFKDLLRASPHHGFSELHQLDTFYNALNSKDQDSLNSVVGGNFLDKMPRECLAIIESKSKVHYSCNKPVVLKVSTNASTSGISPNVSELKDMVKALLLDKKSQSPAPMKAVEESCVTCGGAHSYLNWPATDGNVVKNEPEVTKETINPTNKESTKDVQPQVVQSEYLILTFEPITSPISEPVIAPEKLSEMARTPLNEQCYAVLLKKLPEKLGDLDKFLIPCDVPELADRSISRPVGVAEDVYVNVGELTLRVGKEAVTFNLDQTSRYSANYSDMRAKRIDVIDMAYEEYSQEVLGFFDTILNGNPTPFYDSIVSITSLTLTSFEISDFLLEEVDAFLAIEDEPTSSEFYQPYLENKEKLSEMARTPLNEQCYAVLLKKLPEKLGDLDKFLIPCDVPELADRSISRLVGVAEDVYVNVGELTLRVGKEAVTFNLDQTSRYSANYSDMRAKRIDVIDMAYEEYSQEVLGFFDTISNGNPTLFYDSIVSITSLSPFTSPFTDFLLEEKDFEPAVQHQRRVNPKIHNVIKQEVIKLLEAGLIYPISDSQWISPVHCIPKKGGFTVVENEDNEARKPLKSSRLATMDPQDVTMAQITQPKRVLLFNSGLKIFSGKLKSHWSGPFTISQVYPYRTVELSQPDRPNFKVNGHHLKHYFREDMPKLVVPDLQTLSRDN
nr:reverse transcriptase domain-containing protein [Tanacetum cinerariifolium]